MRYEDFAHAWREALTSSRLRTMGRPEETLELRTMERRQSIFVAPIGEQIAPPFHVTAELWWIWDALLSARTETTEEDMLMQVLGDCDEVETERPRLRIDVKLHATVSLGQSISMPAPERWARWAEEAMERLTSIEPVIGEPFEEGDDDLARILAWQGRPTAQCVIDHTGALHLEALELTAWQGIDLPRIWDDPDRWDEPPDEALGQFFARIRASLWAWMEVLDHLAPRKADD